MKKYIHNILILLFLAILGSSVWGDSSVKLTKKTEKEILKISESFLKALKSEKESQIKPLLYDGYSISGISADDEKQLIKDFASGKITSFDFIKITTGNNLYLFLEDNSSRSLELKSYDNGDRVKLDVMEIKGTGKIPFFYLKARIQYKKKKAAGAPSKNANCEIDLTEVDGKYKIIGFTF